MTHRERQLAAIRHQVADRVPVDCICIEPIEAIAAHLGIAPEAVHDALGIDGRLVAPAWLGEPRVGLDGQPLSAWGTVPSGDYGTARWAPLAGATSIAEVERHRLPDPAEFDYAGAARRAADMADYAVRGPYWLPLFCGVCDLFGMERALLHLALEPRLFEAALERIFAVVHEVCRRLLEASGEALPILCLGDDFATQRGLMMSPAVWRRYLLPRYAALFELARQRGRSVWFHSCGDITAVLPDLIEAGMDVWETVQLDTLPLGATDLKREYGRDLCFFGGISTQRLPYLTPDQVRTETRRCLEQLGAGGGYICGPDHHLKPDVPPANAVALFGEAVGFGGM